MMKLTWVTERNMWEGHAEELDITAEFLGHDIVTIDDSLDRPLPVLEGNVVVHGSFQLARKVLAETTWNPGVICTLDNYIWTEYAPKLSKGILLNDDWKMSTTSELVRMAESNELGECFVRPSAGDKPFGGTAFFGDRLLWLAMTKMFLRDGGDVPIIVSPLRGIGREFRIVVIGDKAVASSMYMNGGFIDIKAGAPDGAIVMAERAAKEWKPDPAFVVDVAETDDGYSVVEYNAFSTSDWYGCELLPILRGISDMLWDKDFELRAKNYESVQHT